MRSGRGCPLTHWLWFAFATYRDLAIDQIRLIAAQQLQLGSAHWPLQLDFYIGVFLKTFHSQQESVEELGSAWAAAARRLCLFQQEPAQPLGVGGGAERTMAQPPMSAAPLPKDHQSTSAT